MSRDGDAPKPITREELEGMSHKDLAKVGTKRRLLASLPSSEEPSGDGGADEGADETLTPAQRMARGHERADQARATRRAETSDRGGNDGE
jgi:hypothetical protein